MQDLIINNTIKFIKNNNTNYNNQKIEEIKYGLISIYLLISKMIVILFLSYVLGITKELIIFTILYNIIRMPSFGLHATKSWICLVSSTIVFLGIPMISLNIFISKTIKIIIGIIVTLLFFKNSPADTHKRPIINSKRRTAYKIISAVISIIYTLISILIKNNFISNCLIFALICQSVLISPLTYKLFKLPYNNYKNYIKKQ